MAKVQIKGAEYPIGAIFSNHFVFRIPLYQRPYSWTEQQAEELLDDLLGFVDDGPDGVSDLNPYFLGSVVVIKGDDPEADVVDGQQRLTTLTILLSAIRALLPKAEAEAVTGYIYERGNPIVGTSDRFRLSLRDRDAAFFRDYVQAEGQIEKLRNLGAVKLKDAQQNIQQNAVLLLDRLKELSATHRWRLIQYIIKQCLLVVVSTPDMDSAFRIFTILNNRGLDLSHADILKSQIIGRVPVAQQEEYGEKWEDAEDLLGQAAFGDLFSHTRAIFRRQKLKGTVLAEFQEYVLKAVPDSKKLIDSVLIPFADAYANIRASNYESATGADDVNRLLRWLNRIDNVDWVPPAILFLSKNRHDPAALQRFFADLERLAAVLMICRASVNQRIDRYAKLVEAIEGGGNLFAPSSPLQVSAQEQAETVRRLDGDIYHMLPKVRMYVMLRLDSVLAGAGAVYEHDKVTVEHVLPQNPPAGSKWLTWFPLDTERDRVVHRLGNLALLTGRKNAAAKNYEFDTKKTSYFNSKGGGVSVFVITTQVLKVNEWTAAVVDARQADLVGQLKTLWKL